MYKTRQSRNKQKRRYLLIAAGIMLLTGVFMAIGLNKPIKAHAAAQWEIELEQRMESKYFTHNGQSYHINNYFSQLHGNKGSSSDRVQITNLVNFKVIYMVKGTVVLTSRI